MKKLIIILSLAIIVFVSCKKTENNNNFSSSSITNQSMISMDKKSEVFSGDFIYFADSANFFDRKTGLRFPVAMEGEYIKLEKMYTDLKFTEPKKVYVELEGYIDERPAMEGDGKETNIIVTKVIMLDSAKGSKN